MVEQARKASRATRQRADIQAVLAATTQFRSAQQLHADLRARGSSVGLTTVYRTLQALAEAGELDAIRLPDGGQLYRRCSPTRHHHLTCRRCARTVEIVGPDLAAWTDRVSGRHGFTQVRETLELLGVCAECATDGATG